MKALDHLKGAQTIIKECTLLHDDKGKPYWDILRTQTKGYNLLGIYGTVKDDPNSIAIQGSDGRVHIVAKHAIHPYVIKEIPEFIYEHKEI